MTDYELYAFSQWCECCPHVTFLAQAHQNFVWWEGPFNMTFPNDGDGKSEMPRFHFYFHISQYIQALQKLEKEYEETYGEDPLADEFRSSASITAEAYEVRATDPLPHHNYDPHIKTKNSNNTPHKKGNTHNKKILQTKKKEIASHQMHENHRKQDMKRSNSRKHKENI